MYQSYESTDIFIIIKTVFSIIITAPCSLMCSSYLRHHLVLFSPSQFHHEYILPVHPVFVYHRQVLYHDVTHRSSTCGSVSLIVLDDFVVLIVVCPDESSVECILHIACLNLIKCIFASNLFARPYVSYCDNEKSG